MDAILGITEYRLCCTYLARQSPRDCSSRVAKLPRGDQLNLRGHPNSYAQAEIVSIYPIETLAKIRFRERIERITRRSKNMEGIRNQESQAARHIQKLIRELVDKAPNEPAMENINTELLRATKASQESKNRVMEEAFKSAYGHYNSIAAKQYDVLEELEQIVEKIRALGGSSSRY
jgi:hypothetical protein